MSRIKQAATTPWRDCSKGRWSARSECFSRAWPCSPCGHILEERRDLRDSEVTSCEGLESKPSSPGKHAAQPIAARCRAVSHPRGSEVHGGSQGAKVRALAGCAPLGGFGKNPRRWLFQSLEATGVSWLVAVPPSSKLTIHLHISSSDTPLLIPSHR